ncbi:proprotein convertase P-domain-containing protein [Luminiphilus sp.]|nr:proprotein convertase P-domain-containing protein [Luminiphilus sp.]
MRLARRIGRICLTIIAVAGSSAAGAAPCPGFTYTLTNQAEVDALGETGCDVIEGSLNISGSDITNIDSLANLTSVGDGLGIDSNAALTNLDGLANISSVGGYLFIISNQALTNLDGLANISSVGGGGLSIFSNQALTNLDGLANITSVGDYLQIYDNAALTNLDGLANISSVGGDLYIFSNQALTNLDGLANISSVGGYLDIRNNAALTNLNGLANITSVGATLIIDRNYNASCEGVAQLLGFPDGPPDDTVGGDIDIGNNGSGCDSIDQILASVSGPTKPTITSASAIGAGSISLELSSSTTTDVLFPISGYEAACAGSSADLSEAPAASLLDNTPVTQTLSVSGYDPVSVQSAIEVDIDITHSDPADLHITLTTPQGTELVLWDRGGSGGANIVGTFPTTLTPIDTISSVGRQAMDGDWVLRVEDVDFGPLVREGVLNAWGLRISESVTGTGSGSPITVNGVTRGRDYSCTVAPVTGLGTGPVSDAVTVNVPLELPATPTVTSTDYEDGTIRLTVSVADNGGEDITEYSASCTDGTSTFTGTSSTPTIDVTGLTNGTAYTCSASATNAVGSSGASVSTDSITPEALSTGLPIWLLYEATK